MISEINNSKEVIKTRMLRHALTYWGIKNTDDLDPVVKLIMEALSSELYNLGNEIKDSHVRILEKIATLLAPDFLTAPNPAHGLLQIAPVEPMETITRTTGFLTSGKISSKQNEVLDTALEITFTPVDSVRIFDVQLIAMAGNAGLYGIDQNGVKQFIAKPGKNFPEHNTLWLGLRVNEKIETLNNLFFCFDWKSVESNLAIQTYQLLPLTQWSINNKKIKVSAGIPYLNDESSTTYEQIFSEYDLLTLIEKDIKRYYDQKYLFIDDDTIGNPQQLKENFPASFTNHFSENDLKKLNDKMIWIKVVFPAALQKDYLNDVYIYPNIVPVINRQVNDLKFRLKGSSNIIPLRTGDFEQFLAVRSLTDETNIYKPVPYRKMDEEQTGTFTLRNGGVERFDARSARELINYVLELLRSESAAFSAYGYDFIAITLREMHQKISLMEQKTRAYLNSAAEIPNYIIVKPFEGFDVMYVEYWTTLAELANNIRAGTKLQQAKGVKVKQDNLTLISTTVGGRGRLRPEERLNAFRYGIMTRDRIITREDIKNFCFYELGDRINAVEVLNGYEMLRHPNEAFRRTIDVRLSTTEETGLKQKDWDMICDQLKAKLQTRSGMSNYYRVFVKK